MRQRGEKDIPLCTDVCSPLDPLSHPVPAWQWVSSDTTFHHTEGQATHRYSPDVRVEHKEKWATFSGDEVSKELENHLLRKR